MYISDLLIITTLVLIPLFLISECSSVEVCSELQALVGECLVWGPALSSSSALLIWNIVLHNEGEK